MKQGKLFQKGRPTVYRALIHIPCARCPNIIAPSDLYTRRMKKGGGRGACYATCETCVPLDEPGGFFS